MYLVSDPFNKGYNPAKVLSDSPEAHMYEQKFRAAFTHLKNGQTIFMGLM
jgi:hypothetical protein